MYDNIEILFEYKMISQKTRKENQNNLPTNNRKATKSQNDLQTDAS